VYWRWRRVIWRECSSRASDDADGVRRVGSSVRTAGVCGGSGCFAHRWRSGGEIHWPNWLAGSGRVLMRRRVCVGFYRCEWTDPSAWLLGHGGQQWRRRAERSAWLARVGNGEWGSVRRIRRDFGERGWNRRICAADAVGSIAACPGSGARGEARRAERRMRGWIVGSGVL
jgi:hypothetical protein